MSGFVCGINLAMALWCGCDWLKDRRQFNAVMFWLNLGFGALNAWTWLG